METSVVAAGSTAGRTFSLLENSEDFHTRTVLVNSRYDSIETGCPDRVIRLGSPSNDCPEVLERAANQTKDWTSGRDEILEEFIRTDVVLLAAHLETTAGVYISRYVADLMNEVNTLRLAVVGTPGEESGSFRTHRARRTVDVLRERTDFLLPVGVAGGAVRNHLGGLMAKVLNRLEHGEDLVGNLERLVHSSGYERDLMRRTVSTSN